MNVSISSNINVGCIGHVDEGKTTLTAAITKISRENFDTDVKSFAYDEIDNAPEEKKGGITINRRTVFARSSKRAYSIMDCPGHKDYIKNMITGVSQMDCAILTVSAPTGVMPQTREHVCLASCIGVKHIVCFMNKIDLVDDPEIAEFAQEDVKEVLSANGYDGESVKFVEGSALCALEGTRDDIGKDKIIELFSVLDDINVGDASSEGDFLMSIEGVHSIPGRGTVITGCPEQGTLKVNSEVEISGLRDPIKTICTGIEAFHKSLPEAKSGNNVGLLLRGIKREEVERGQVVAVPGTIKCNRKFTADICVISKENGGRHTAFCTNYRPQFYCRTCDVTGSIILDEDTQMVMPGDDAKVTVELVQSIPLSKGLRFVIREGGKTIGYGIVTGVCE